MTHAEFGAGHPLREWLAQRATALLMTLYTLLLLALLAVAPEMNFSVWCRIFLPLPMKIATMLFLTCAFFHAWIGMRNIFMDYIKPAALRRTLYGITIGVLVIYAGWSAYILFKAI